MIEWFRYKKDGKYLWCFTPIESLFLDIYGVHPSRWSQKHPSLVKTSFADAVLFAENNRIHIPARILLHQNDNREEEIL